MSLYSLCAVAALAVQPSPASVTDLELFAQSLGPALHDHPFGTDGWLLDRAERVERARLARLMPWLRSRYSADQLVSARCGYPGCEGSIDYVAGASISLEEEWRAIRIMRSALSRLERRQHAATGAH